MVILVASVSTLLIYIPVGVFAVKGEGYLEQRLLSGSFDPGVELIPASGITPFDMACYRRRHIVPVIRDMRVDMATVAVVMGNHFPTVGRTVIGKVGVPLISRMRPSGVGRLRILPLKIVLDGSRDMLIFMSALSHSELAASGQQKDEECFHSS
jgi:hypothetical protein